MEFISLLNGGIVFMYEIFNQFNGRVFDNVILLIYFFFDELD
jgi:hypothetical protein